ncbi:MAG: LPS assembly lipoprotein LptE [Puniceicoccales bacterium]|jgi:hypothetical protein|nr:LPS assembly lipoprotein LptE [Puniceicoccales bacterium]
MFKIFAHCLVIFALLLGGCTSNYHLGKSETLPFKSICVQIVGNESLVPQIQAVITKRLGDECAKDSRLVVTSDADAILNVVILSSRQNTSATSSSDTGLASYLTISLSAACTLIDGKSGTEYFSKEIVSTEADLLVDNDYQARKDQVMPKICDELAKKIVNMVIHPWIAYEPKIDSSVNICR